MCVGVYIYTYVILIHKYKLPRNALLLWLHGIFPIVKISGNGKGLINQKYYRIRNSKNETGSIFPKVHYSEYLIELCLVDGTTNFLNIEPHFIFTKMNLEYFRNDESFGFNKPYLIFRIKNPQVWVIVFWNYEPLKLWSFWKINRGKI